jgi:hypothetical protein
MVVYYTEYIAYQIYSNNKCYYASSLITTLSLLLYHAYHLFLHMLSTNHKCTQPCYFPPDTQTCCSEAGEDLEYFHMVF